MLKLTCYFLGFIMLAFLFSCTGGKKLRAIKQTLEEAKQINYQTLLKIDSAEKSIQQKVDMQTLDEASAAKMMRYTDSLGKEIQNHINEDSIILSKKISHKELGPVTMKSIDMLQKAKLNLENVTIVNEILSTNTFVEFNTSSLFGPGKYIMDDNLISRNIFEPVVKEMVDFAGKFPGKKLTSSIIVLGFADAQPVAPDSRLAQILLSGMAKESAPSHELNKELSRLRAESVTKLLYKMTAERTKGKAAFNSFSIDVLPQGRGEEFPDKKINNYNDEDERRRIVKLFWNILPF